MKRIFKEGLLPKFVSSHKLSLILFTAKVTKYFVVVYT